MKTSALPTAGTPAQACDIPEVATKTPRAQASAKRGKPAMAPRRRKSPATQAGRAKGAGRSGSDAFRSTQRPKRISSVSTTSQAFDSGSGGLSTASRVPPDGPTALRRSKRRTFPSAKLSPAGPGTAIGNTSMGLLPRPQQTIAQEALRACSDE